MVTNASDIARAGTPTRPPKLAALGALAGGVAALSCCVLPLVFVTVGISGAWIANLTALSPYQPLFIAGALTAIGAGFWQARRVRRACAAGDACVAPLPRRLVDGALWTGLALVAVAVAVNTFAPYLIS